MFSKIYLLYRKISFFPWRILSKSEMERIAAHYHCQVELKEPDWFGEHPFLKGVKIIGLCYIDKKANKRLLFISSARPKTFWHELGHIVCPPYRHKTIIGWAISEISATMAGYYLNFKWKKGVEA